MSSLFASRWAETPPPAEDSAFTAPPKEPVKEETSLPSPVMSDPAEPASLRASRWADTPPPNDEPFSPLPQLSNGIKNAKKDTPAPKSPTKAEPVKESVKEPVVEKSVEVEPVAEKPVEEKAAAENSSEPVKEKLIDVPTPETEKPLPLPPTAPEKDAEDTPKAPLEEAVREQATADKDLPKVPVEETSEVAKSLSEEKNEPPAEPVAPIRRLEIPPPLRKTVSFRGKKIHIAIPKIDFVAAGLPQPLSQDEVQARIQGFEEAGYSTSGFDRPVDDNDPAQVRPIWPVEAENRQLPSKEEFKVILPDLAKWRAYQDWLTEQKLAALGVTTAVEEPAPAQDLSRASSAQYPPLPFSPPLLPGSAASISRPGAIRGHSHTMSVASPVSPLNGPFGHMHRHSTVNGSINLGQLQTSMQQGIIPGMSPFSPQGFPFPGRVGSPAQLAALRNELGSARGPGSPLSNEILQQLQDPNGLLMDGQRSRQHSYSQSMYQSQLPMLNNALLSQTSSIRPTPMLPELPEDEDEDLGEPQEPEAEAEPETPTYVPPHKRAMVDTEIAVPTPRGHRHNISEGLERDLLEREQRHKISRDNFVEVTEEGDDSEETSGERRRSSILGAKSWRKPSGPVEKDPLSQDLPVQETAHNRKKSGTRLNVAAAPFTFNPTAEFTPSFQFGFQPPPGQFTFGAPVPTMNDYSFGHMRNQSSGTFNAAAPAFQPKMNADFNFSAALPSAKPTAEGSGTDSETGAIFGKVNIPDIVKPARRSKAIAIVRPEDRKPVDSGEEREVEEDSEGRIVQTSNPKKQRKGGDDGDEVPLFAEPAPVTPVLPPPEKILGSNDDAPVPASAADVLDNIEEESPVRAPPADLEKTPPANELPTAEATVQKKSHYHKHSHSLSGAAKPFIPGFFQMPTAPTEEAEPKKAHEHIPSISKIKAHEHFASISELEEGEIREADSSPIQTSATLFPHREQAPVANGSFHQKPFGFDDRINTVAQPEPSFNEIDAIMQHLNDDPAGPQPPQQREVDEEPTALPPSPGSHPMQGVTYLAEWSRSDAPSPSPRRHHQPSFDHLRRQDSLEQFQNGWPHVNRLNKAEEVPTSDWSGILSPPDEEKLQQRSSFFDSRIDSVISRIFEERLQPLEESLRSLHSTVTKRTRSDDRQHKRGSSNTHSDADDEDEISNAFLQRPISRGRDKRVDQMKAAVLEALREASPQRSQAAIELADLHSILTDMKVSFARAASNSLELDDIKVVVDEAIHRQSQALIPVVKEDTTEAHKREITELHNRINDTLAGALEEANHRRAAEEREAEARRLLRLAEEELRLVRETAADNASRVRALEEEREDVLDRLEKAEEARRTAEEERKDAEDQNEALQSTLEEYRTSSNRWRQEIDEGRREREELRNTLITLERQSKDNEEAAQQEREQLNATLLALKEQAQQDEEAARRYREEHGATVAEHERQIKHSRGVSMHEQGELRSTISALQREAEQLRDASERDQEVLRAEITALEGQVAALQNQAEETREAGRVEQRELQGELMEVQRLAKETHEASLRDREELQAKLAKAQALSDEIREASAREREELQAEFATFKRSTEELEEISKREQEVLQAEIAKVQRDAQEAQDASRRERDELRENIKSLERQVDEHREASSGMKRRLEKLHSDMATAAGQLLTEKSQWKAREEDMRARYEALEAQSNQEARERIQLEDELRAARSTAHEVPELRNALEQSRKSNASLEELVRKLQGEVSEQQNIAARFERQFHDAQETGRTEVHRTRMALETDIEAANHQVNLVRAELESDLIKTRAELDNLRMEAETAKARHEHRVEEEEINRREALRKVNHSNSVALDEARHKYETAIQDLQAQHARTLKHAFEDKDRSEHFLNERLALSDAKLQHFQDRVRYLEDRLEITKSAAQAAAQNAQYSKSGPQSSMSGVPEKVSPQALRESILVLQEQLQERETRIERLQAQAEEVGGAKLKERDDEIAWLRELLAVRREELGDLVKTLSRPSFDRESVRDTAIRIRANLQMEQEEKERFGHAPQTLGGQALASLSSFASPKLSSAFNKWRSTMESSSLKTQARPGMSGRSPTPSRSQPSRNLAAPPGYQSGLMTPPASNIRNSPVPESTNSLPPPRLHPRTASKSSQMSHLEPASIQLPKSRQSSTITPGPRPSTPPLFREQSYDQDAEDSNHVPTFEDDDLEDVADSQPPAFRSLEDELMDPDDDTSSSLAANGAPAEIEA